MVVDVLDGQQDLAVLIEDYASLATPAVLPNPVLGLEQANYTVGQQNWNGDQEKADNFTGGKKYQCLSFKFRY